MRTLLCRMPGPFPRRILCSCILDCTFGSGERRLLHRLDRLPARRPVPLVGLLHPLQPQAKPIRQQLRQSHQALAAAIKAGKSDEELTQLSQQQSALVAQLTAIRAKAFARLYAQLTEEQKQKAEQMHERMSQRWGRRGVSQ